MEKDRNTLVLYSTAVCNLKCRYCYIDKNPALIKIDDELKKSFCGDYYFNFAKKVFPNPNQLTSIEIWGGEPSLGLDRTYYTLEKLFEYYPNISRIFMSSNMTTEIFLEQIEGIFKIFNNFPERNFEFSLQMSLDGPVEINDINRGKGVTELFTKTYAKLMEKMPVFFNSYKNFHFTASFKPTLDSSSIRFLQSKEKIISYYKFFESYMKAATHIQTLFPYRFTLNLPIPNTACPSPHTVEDGKLFCNLVKLCREIEKDNKENKIFQYYLNITPFGYNRNPEKNDLRNCGCCGTGKTIIGLLPNNMISTCHNGFTQLLSDYKQDCLKNKEVDRTIDFRLFSETLENDMVFPYENLSAYEKQIELFYDPNEQFVLINYVGLIQFLALAGQISEKYKNYKEAIKGANLIFGRTSICLRDHMSSTGSKTLPPMGLFKLLLNGADEYLLQEGESV